MLPRVAGAAPPPRKPRRSGGSFHLVYFYPGLPEDFSVRAHPPLQLLSPPHPTPPRDLRSGVDGREGGKKRSRGRRELGGMDGHSGRGACAGKRPGKAGRRGPCVAAAAARCRRGCCPRRPIPGGGVHGACPPRAAREQPRPPPPANSGPFPMATNQSEAGWAGSRERLLLRRGWRPGAARTVSRCSSLTVSLTPARRNPAPWPAPQSGGRKMESRCPREVRPVRARPLAPLSRRPEASLSPPTRDAHSARVVPARQRRPGGRRGWAHRRACADRPAAGRGRSWGVGT